MKMRARRYLISSLCYYGVLILAGCQVPTKAALSLPLTTGQGRENITKGSWVKIGKGRDHSPVTITGKQTRHGN